jgi:hypothetical protein
MLTRKVRESGTHLDFATCTTERKDVGSTLGNDLTTRVRTVSSVADAGNEDRNSDIWVHESSNVEMLRWRTYDRFVFWGLEALLFGMASQDFARDRVIVPEKPILDILLRQLGLLGHLVSTRNDSAHTILGRETM